MIIMVRVIVEMALNRAEWKKRIHIADTKKLK